ncbi:MAG TPA: hypothetical protein VMT00_05075 [Thermoanaerobaculia bacterium]|nr:hypothetical protein [Thermoanaerobaculia bacterium]
MAKQQGRILVLDHGAESAPWKRLAKNHPIDICTQFDRLSAVFAETIESTGVRAVVFDKVIGVSLFMEFLCGVSRDFDGDVIMIEPSGYGLVSHRMKDGRRDLYRLDSQGVAYCTSRLFRETSSEPGRIDLLLPKHAALVGAALSV